MSRLVLPSLVCAALALASAPSLARANDDGMCVVVHAVAFEVGADHSVDPAELQTADPATRSEGEGADPGRGARHLLCARADDPRCSPLSAEDTPASPDLPARASALLVEVLRLPPRPLREVAFGATALLGASFGEGLRTYRPPRA